MPRGRKASSKTFDEQIAEIELQIVEYKQEIERLKAHKKAIFAAKEKAEIDKLMVILKESGKTPADLIATLKDNMQ